MHTKLIGCSLYGPIKISKMALKMIDTPEFQRLRNIKQLGICSYVFPAATHTRFEHSLGTYHLSRILTTNLRQNYPDKIFDTKELGPIKLDPLICECINIAALYHDIGHVAFSHLSDNIFQSLSKSELVHHEARSCKLVELICKRELKDELNDNHVKFIQTIINPDPLVHQGALYQIVANQMNNVDLDKFDYLARDSYSLGLNKGFDSRRIIDNMIIDNNNNLAYAKHCSTEIYEMFHNRYMNHKKVYNCKVVKIIESMIFDIILLTEPIFNMSKMIDDMNQFCKLTDTTIFYWLEEAIDNKTHMGKKINKKNMEIIKKAYGIYQDIIMRKLYKCVAETFDKEPDQFRRFIEYLKSNNVSCDYLHIISVNIGFVSSNDENPFDSIYFYDSKVSETESFLMDKNKISNMLSNIYTEDHHFLICKNRTLYLNTVKMYEDFQKN